MVQVQRLLSFFVCVSIKAVMPLSTLNSIAEGSTIRSEPAVKSVETGRAPLATTPGDTDATQTRTYADVCMDATQPARYQRHYQKLMVKDKSVHHVKYSGHASNLNPSSCRNAPMDVPKKRFSGMHQKEGFVPSSIATTCDHYDHLSALNSFSVKNNAYGNTDNFPSTISMIGAGNSVPSTIHSYLQQSQGLSGGIDEPFKRFAAKPVEPKDPRK